MLAAFLEIGGAYDNTLYTSMVHSARGRGVNLLPRISLPQKDVDWVKHPHHHTVVVDYRLLSTGLYNPQGFFIFVGEEKSISAHFT